MLAAKRTMLMVKALSTQLISMRPLSMKRSSRASTRTSTAASAKNEEQRCAEIAMSSKSGEGVFCGELPPPGGTKVNLGALPEDCCESFAAFGAGVKVLRMEFET